MENGVTFRTMEYSEATKDENIGKFKAPYKLKDLEHPSFWECRLKPNPHYLGAVDGVCAVMSEWS